jgi:hypothetical protein
MATDRVTGRTVPIGTTPEHGLRAHVFRTTSVRGEPRAAHQGDENVRTEPGADCP